MRHHVDDRGSEGGTSVVIDADKSCGGLDGQERAGGGWGDQAMGDLSGDTLGGAEHGAAGVVGLLGAASSIVHDGGDE